MEFWELLVYSLEFPYSQMEFRALQLNYLSSNFWIEFTQVQTSKSYLNYHLDCSTQSRISAKAMEEYTVDSIVLQWNVKTLRHTIQLSTT